MAYPQVLKLPQYFRNIGRLSEILAVLAKHGFGDLIDRLQVRGYIEKGLRVVWPSFPSSQYTEADFATRFRRACEELGPTFVKFAQVLGTRPDLFPEAVVRECKKLQDQAPAFEFSAALSIIEGDLGIALEDIFSSFEKAPVAAASIAQVHQATLHSGEKVAVKVQRPGIVAIIDTDLDILRGLAALFEDRIEESRLLKPSELVEEFARSLRRECDFKNEARFVRKFSSLYSAEENFKVPKIFEKFCSSRVLVEEFIEGVKCNHPSVLEMGLETRQQITATLNHIFLSSVFEHRFFHADPHSGNILVQADGTIAFIDFGAMGHIEKSRLNAVVQFLLGLLERDAEKVVRVLAEADTLPSGIDELSLRVQISEIIDNYLGERLGQLDIGRLLSEIFEVIRKFAVRPPSDLLLVGKSLTTLVTIAAELNPDWDPVSALKPYLLRYYLREVANPRTYSRFVGEMTDSYRKLMFNLPNELRQILAKLARGNLSVMVSQQDLLRLSRHHNSLLNRLIGTLVGLTCLVLSINSLQSSNAHPGLSYGLLAIAGLLLGAVWLAVRRSGGM